MKALKIIGKIILIIIIIIILFIITLILTDVPFGIILPFGWGAITSPWAIFPNMLFGFLGVGTPQCDYYEYTGFPFSVTKIGIPRACSEEYFNNIAFVLNFLFLVLSTFIIYLIFRRIFIKK